MSELDKLIEAVECGLSVESHFNAVWNPMGKQWINGSNAMKADDGSIDAAKALHEALLPGWIVQELSQNSRSMGWNMLLVNPGGTYISSHYGDIGFIICPARAWLIAILKAYRAQQETQE